MDIFRPKLLNSIRSERGITELNLFTIIAYGKHVEGNCGNDQWQHIFNKFNFLPPQHFTK